MKLRRRSTLKLMVVGTVSIIFLVQFLITSSKPEVQGIIHAHEVDCFDPELEKRGVNLGEDTKLVIMKFFLPQYGRFHGKLFYRPYMNCADQEEDMLAQLVKKEYFHEPVDKPYNFSKPEHKIKPTQQTLDVIELVYQRPENIPRDGFFIEAGASDSGRTSVSLEFERKYGWTGLLVEPNPGFFEAGLTLNRKSVSVNTCLGIKEHPHYAMFNFQSAVRPETGKHSMGGIAKDSARAVQMQCIPLYTLINAAGNPRINLLILDVEGADLMVLRTIPWDKVDIEVMSIETDLIGQSIGGETQLDLIRYVEEQGYTMFEHREEINKVTGLYQNHLFVRNDIVRKYNVKGYRENYKAPKPDFDYLYSDGWGSEA